MHLLPRAAIAVAACAGVLMFTGCASGVPQQDTPFRLERFAWQGQLASPAGIVAQNDYGDLRVRVADYDRVVVSAVIQQLGRMREEFAVRVDESGADLVIRVEALVRDPEGRVDMALLAPAGRVLRVGTAAGLVQVKRYPGTVVVRSEAGSISLLQAGSVDAFTGSGTISAGLTAPPGERLQGPWRFATTSGDIEVRVANGIDAALDARSGGGVVNELGAALRVLDGRPEALRGVLGGGGDALSIESATGRVVVGTLEP